MHAHPDYPYHGYNNAGPYAGAGQYNDHNQYVPYPDQTGMNGYPHQMGMPYPNGMQQQVAPGTPDMLPLEQSYIENILRFNRGKVANFYMTFENNPDWQSRVFRGRIEEAGRDHIIISNDETGRNYLLLMVYLDYVEFDDEIDYIPPPGIPQAPQR